MIINKNYEVELNLRDLLFHVLYKWRIIILISMIVGGVFGYKEYWSFEKYHRNGELTPAEIQYETEMGSYQKAVVQAEKVLAEYEAALQDTNGNRKVPIIMGIDPTNIWTAEKKYYVDANQNFESSTVLTDPSLKILTVLAEAFSWNIEEEKLIDAFGTDAVNDYSEVACICIDKDLKTISVIGCGATKEQAIRRKEFVDSYLISASKELSKNEKYTLEILSDHVASKAEWIRRDVTGEKIEKNLARIQESLNKGYQNYLNQLDIYTRNRNDLIANPPVKPEPKIISQAIFGFALGFFLSAIVIVGIYLFNGKLKTGRELMNRYDLFLVGSFSHSRAWWKGKGIDWILEHLEYGKTTKFENELDSITTLVESRKGNKRILITSTLGEKEIKKVYDGLASRLEKKGIDLILQAEYLHNSKAVEASADIDSVLLIEEKYKSRIQDLNRMATMLTIEEATVIGAILQ